MQPRRMLVTERAEPAPRQAYVWLIFDVRQKNMNIQALTANSFGDLNSDLTEMHKATESDSTLDSEWTSICEEFSKCFKELEHEIPDWHYGKRLFYAYLYSTNFFTPAFHAQVLSILNRTNSSWFAEFECYSHIAPAGEPVDDSFLGWIMIYRDSLIIREDAEKNLYIQKLWPSEIK